MLRTLCVCEFLTESGAKKGLAIILPDYIWGVLCESMQLVGIVAQTIELARDICV